MARTSKKTEVKATETAITSMAEDIKTEDKASESKVAAVQTAGTKKTTAPKAETAPAAAKKETAKKAELSSSLSVQFGGKELSEEALVKAAKDIWKNTLKRKVGDLKSVELYLKPEENKVYYVMNKDVTGSFDI